MGKKIFTLGLFGFKTGVLRGLDPIRVGGGCVCVCACAHSHVHLGEEETRCIAIFRLEKQNTPRTPHADQLLVALVDTA